MHVLLLCLAALLLLTAWRFLVRCCTAGLPKLRAHGLPMVISTTCTGAALPSSTATGASRTLWTTVVAATCTAVSTQLAVAMLPMLLVALLLCLLCLLPMLVGWSFRTRSLQRR